MLKICRKTKFINYEYYNNHTLIGKITNKIFINIIKFSNYKILFKTYVNIIFYLSIFITIIYSNNIKLTLLLFIIIFLFRYIWSLYDISKIYIQNNVVGSVKHTIFSNTIKINLNSDKYEIYSHGGNYFSVMKDNFQIALINTDGKIIMNELYFVADYLSDYYDILILFIILIDSVFYKPKIGKRTNLIYFSNTTYNFHDKHKERTIWKSNFF